MAKKSKSDNEIRWEDLMEVRQQLVKELIGNQAFLNTIVNSYMEYINKDKELKAKVIGIFKSLTDISKTIMEITKQHVTFKEDGTVEGYKKGIIDADDLDYLDYNTINSNYIAAGEQVINIVSFGYQEIVTSLNSKLKFLSDDEVKSIQKVLEEEQVKLNKKILGATHGIFKTVRGKRKPKPKGGERHKDLPRLPGTGKSRSKNKYGTKPTEPDEGTKNNPEETGS